MSRLGQGEFAKYHGLGNDYLALDAERFGAPLSPARVRTLCDRHHGPGADGIVARVAARQGDFAVRIYNPDGSEAEKSGTGLRVFARFLYDFAYTRRRKFTVETKGGAVAVHLHLRGGKVSRATVDMGQARFERAAIPVRSRGAEVVDEPWTLDGERVRVTCVSMGNPHCVVFVRRLRRQDLLRLGPKLERDPRFPERTNVQLARVRTRKRIEVLVWERGAGETLASGTSSCAVAAAALRLDKADRCVTVELPGGDLPIRITRDYAVRLTGPVTAIMRGRLLR